jgi:hypothetical protein
MKIYQANQNYGYNLKEIGHCLSLNYTNTSKIITRVADEKGN